MTTAVATPIRAPTRLVVRIRGGRSASHTYRVSTTASNTEKRWVGSATAGGERTATYAKMATQPATPASMTVVVIGPGRVGPGRRPRPTATVANTPSNVANV